jgi:hypothetical protein
MRVVRMGDASGNPRADLRAKNLAELSVEEVLSI